MALVKAHELNAIFERTMERRLRSLKIPKPKALAEELAGMIMDEVPTEAFDPKTSWEQGILYFHGDVDRDHVLEVQDYLTASHVNIKPGIPMTLYLSSFGGECMAGLALASTIQEIRRSGRTVNIHIQGCAMSMGSLLAQVGDHRSIEPYAWFMIHEVATGIEYGKTHTIKDEAEFMDRLEQQIFSLYSARTSKPVDYWRKKMHRRDWFLTPQEALDEGLVDEIKPIPPYKRIRRKKAA